MLQVFRASASVSRWVAGAVVVRLGPGAGVSRFPAMPHAMLTVQSADGDAPGAACLPLVSPASLHTLSTAPTAYPHAGRLRATGLLVRPEAAARLLGRAGSVAVDQVLSWREIAGDTEAARLDEAMQSAAGDRARVAALESSLCRATVQAWCRHGESIDDLCVAVGNHGAQAAGLLDLSERQLQRRCQAVLGLGPKRFQRLVRFHAALSGAVMGGRIGGAELAQGTGFYDQSHLGREARQLAGTRLGTLLAQAQPDAPWWSLASHRLLQGAAQPLR